MARAIRPWAQWPGLNGTVPGAIWWAEWPGPRDLGRMAGQNGPRWMGLLSLGRGPAL